MATKVDSKPQIQEKDAARVRFPPPLVYLFGMASGALLHAFVLEIPFDIPTTARVVLSASVTLIGVGVLLSAVAKFKDMGQDVKPWKTTPEISTDGIYKVTRNPMYVGMALAQAGIGIGLSNLWIVAFVLPVLVVVYFIAVRPEEEYLASKFGESYQSYRNSVRRWL